VLLCTVIGTISGTLSAIVAYMAYRRSAQGAPNLPPAATLSDIGIRRPEAPPPPPESAVSEARPVSRVKLRLVMHSLIWSIGLLLFGVLSILPLTGPWPFMRDMFGQDLYFFSDLMVLVIFIGAFAFAVRSILLATGRFTA